MSASRSSNLSPVITEEPTPKPASAVGSSSQRGIERQAALLEYFANLPPEMCEMDAAWQEALTHYGDENSDAWVFALKDGTHPLCRVRIPKRSA
jgi:hypothetical protein